MLPKKTRLFPRYLVGIDEVGRGPLAGPVAVGAVVVPEKHKKDVENRFKGVKDSKKLSRQKRELWLGEIKKAKKEGLLDYRISFVGVRTIDQKGINFSIARAIKSALRRLGVPEEGSKILLDGGLKAPHVYKNQITIIKGDEKEMIISLASIAAKVSRDRRMEILGEKYPEYGFEEHKGYGTTAHMKSIKKYGPIKEHRRSFLKSIY